MVEVVVDVGNLLFAAAPGARASLLMQPRLHS